MAQHENPVSLYTIERAQARIDELKEAVRGIKDETVTTGSEIGDVALRFCVQNDCLNDLGGVIQFWESVDDEVQKAAGDYVIGNNRRSEYFIGKIRDDNDGLEVVGGTHPRLPLDSLYRINLTLAPKKWKEFPSINQMLCSAYLLDSRETEESRRSLMHPSASIIGHMTVGMAAWYCALGFGSDKIEQFQNEFPPLKKYKLPESVQKELATV